MQLTRLFCLAAIPALSTIVLAAPIGNGQYRPLLMTFNADLK